jgi:excisionase family DNA binding protein
MEAAMKRFVARDRLISTTEAAAITGLSSRVIKHYAETGKLPFERVAGTRKRRYRVSELHRLLTNGGTSPQASG